MRRGRIRFAAGRRIGGRRRGDGERPGGFRIRRGKLPYLSNRSRLWARGGKKKRRRESGRTDRRLSRGNAAGKRTARKFATMLLPRREQGSGRRDVRWRTRARCESRDIETRRVRPRENGAVLRRRDRRIRR